VLNVTEILTRRGFRVESGIGEEMLACPDRLASEASETQGLR